MVEKGRQILAQREVEKQQMLERGRQILAQREVEKQQMVEKGRQILAQREVEKQQSFQRNQPSLMGGFPSINANFNSMSIPSFGNVGIDSNNFYSRLGFNKNVNSSPSINNNSSPSINSNSSYEHPRPSSIIPVKNPINNHYSLPSNERINNSSILDRDPIKTTIVPIQNKIEIKEMEPKIEENHEDIDLAEAMRQSSLMSAQISKEADSEDGDLAEAMRLSLLMSEPPIKETDSEDTELAEAMRLSLLESPQPIQKVVEKKSEVISTVDIAEIIKGLPVDTDQNHFLEVIMATKKYIGREEEVINTLKDMLMWFDD